MDGRQKICAIGHPRIQTPPPPWFWSCFPENHKNVGFLSNSGPASLKITVTILAFNDGPAASARQRNAIGRHLMAFHCRTDDGPFIVVSGSNLSSSFKNKQRKIAVIVRPPLTKTVWIRTCRTDSSLFLCCLQCI